MSLELRQVSKSFGARQVFSGISASIESGCLAVTGHNGSGKSTLLRIIAGLLAPSSGQVVLTDGGRQSPVEQRRDLTGMVAPDLALYDELSAIENLRFFARVRGLKKTNDELRAPLVRLGLEGRENDRLGSYSSGMRQRVKYAFALMHNPAVLLLDEPSTNLDEAGIRAIGSIIEEQKRRGIVVLATNHPSELAYGDHVLELGA
ncbi:MAG: ABC transporter ATP-binding protein [Armatimonadetes bacterium]|nr:ABC transporter ATP-binding protein [Armatimonadota bacterium]